MQQSLRDLCRTPSRPTHVPTPKKTIHMLRIHMHMHVRERERERAKERERARASVKSLLLTSGDEESLGSHLAKAVLTGMQALLGGR